jgi:hypothetical protein
MSNDNRSLNRYRNDSREPVPASVITRAGGSGGAAVGVIAAAAVALLTPTVARAQVQPGNLDKTRLRPDARSQAMGGVSLTLLDDAAGAVFNPALIADAGKASVSIQGQANANFPYWEALNFVGDLKDTANQIRDDPSSVNWDNVKGKFDSLYNRAQQIIGNLVQGKAVTGALSLSPTIAASYQNVGLLGYGGIAGIAILTPGTGTGPFDDKRTLDASAGFINITTIAVPYAFKIPAGWMGVSAKYDHANYTGISFLADASTQTLTGRSYQDVRDGAPDIDVGYRTDPRPLSKASGGLTWQGAAAIHYLLFPHFHLPAEVRNESGIGEGTPPPPSDFSFSYKPQLDLGGNVGGKISEHIPWHGALELHNLFGTNGGNLSFHGGGEIVPLQWLAVRAGYDQRGFVYGAGLRFGPVRLDAAAGTDYRLLLAGGLSARF